MTKGAAEGSSSSRGIFTFEQVHKLSEIIRAEEIGS